MTARTDGHYDALRPALLRECSITLLGETEMRWHVTVQPLKGTTKSFSIEADSHRKAERAMSVMIARHNYESDDLTLYQASQRGFKLKIRRMKETDVIWYKKPINAR